MLSTAEILTGVIAGVLADQVIKISEKAQNALKDPDVSNDEKELILLAAILAAVAPKEKENIEDIFALQPYPFEKIIDEEFYGKPHVCIFFHDQTPIRFDIEGVGTYNKTVGPGWIQCDIRGRLSTSDSQSHNIILSYRDDVIGVSL